jgi:hypothetical protein
VISQKTVILITVVHGPSSFILYETYVYVTSVVRLPVFIRAVRNFCLVSQNCAVVTVKSCQPEPANRVLVVTNDLFIAERFVVQIYMPNYKCQFELQSQCEAGLYKISLGYQSNPPSFMGPNSSLPSSHSQPLVVSLNEMNPINRHNLFLFVTFAAKRLNCHRGTLFTCPVL